MVGLVHLFHYVQSVLCEYYRTYIMCVGSFSFIIYDGSDAATSTLWRVPARWVGVRASLRNKFCSGCLR